MHRPCLASGMPTARCFCGPTGVRNLGYVPSMVFGSGRRSAPELWPHQCQKPVMRKCASLKAPATLLRQICAWGTITEQSNRAFLEHSTLIRLRPRLPHPSRPGAFMALLQRRPGNRGQEMNGSHGKRNFARGLRARIHPPAKRPGWAMPDHFTCARAYAASAQPGRGARACRRSSAGCRRGSG